VTSSLTCHTVDPVTKKPDVSERELLALYRSRRHDKTQADARRNKRRGGGDPAAISAILEKVLGKDDVTRRKMDEHRALAGWPTLVGPVVARHSQAERFRGTTLVVRVGDPLWLQQLHFVKRELLTKLQQTFPRLGITEIFFRRG